MDTISWTRFCEAREAYRSYVAELSIRLPELRSVQQRLVDEREEASFPIDTPVVYNQALDKVQKDDEIKIILVADNPGRREQAAENKRYLVGPSGKLADGFFRSHPELGIDFRKNVLILNKTPIHTPRTAELRELGRLGGTKLSQAIIDSQKKMIELIRAFHDAINGSGPSAIPAALWIIGYSELGRGKLFEPFTRALEEAYPEGDPLRSSILLFRHFSMNQFSVDIRKKSLAGEDLDVTLQRTGTEYRQRIFGW
ncbi:hypothetical protein MASR2M78_33970 [Treponema sp.]